MSTTTLKALLVGCGGIAKSWLEPISQRDDISVMGLVDLDLTKAEELRRMFAQNAQVGTELTAMLRTLRPDVVIDCTIPDAHAAIACEALAAGCHVLSEKPLAASLADARRVVAAAAAAGRVHAVMQNRRFLPGIRTFQRLLTDGSIGQLRELHADFFIGVHFGGFRDQMAHVLLLDMAIHTIDQARFLVGADPVAVNALEWNPGQSWYRQDASALVCVEFADGLRFTYRGSWCAEGCPTSWEASWRAIGQQGSALWDGGERIHAERVTSSEGFIHAVAPIEPPPALAMPLQQHAGCIDDMVRAIFAGRDPETVGHDNLKSLAIIHAAIASAQHGGARVAIDSL